MINYKSFFKVILILVVFLLIIFFVYFIFHYVEKNNSSDYHDSLYYDNDSNDEEVYYNSHYYKYNTNIKTYLIIGKDDGSGTDNIDESGECDFLLLLVLDTSEETTKFISINRDTITDVNVLGLDAVPIGSVQSQIAIAHTYGVNESQRCNNTIDAVENILHDVSINHYISLNMDIVKIFVDKIDGVELCLLDDFNFNGIEYLTGTSVLLNGDMAYKYVRARGELTNNTNIDRIKRQNQFIDAFICKLKENDTYSDIDVNDVIESISNKYYCDMNTSSLSDLYDNILHFDYLGIDEIQGSSSIKNEYVEFYVDEDKLNEMIIDTFYILKK